MIDPTNGAPRAEEETITFAGRTCTLRCGTVAAFELSQMNIDAGAIFTVSDRERRITSFAHVLKLFRAVIAHNFIALKQPVPSAEEIAMQLEGASQELLNEITQKTLKVIFPNLMALTADVQLRESAPGIN